MEAIKGVDFNIYIEKDGVPTKVCSSTDFVLRRSRQLIEISGPQGLDQDFIVTRKGYNINISGLVTYVDGYTYLDIENAYENGVRLVWTGRDKLNGGVVHKGVMLFTGLDWSSPVRGAFSFEAAAVGCGPKQTLLTPIITTVYLADQFGTRLAGCPNPYPVTLLWYDNTVIGIANNADDVITQFNSYAGNSYFQLTSYTGGCDFSMSVEWDAPFIPAFIIAIPTPGLAMRTGIDDEAISNDQDNDEVISPNYTV